MDLICTFGKHFIDWRISIWVAVGVTKLTSIVILSGTLTLHYTLYIGKGRFVFIIRYFDAIQKWKYYLTQTYVNDFSTSVLLYFFYHVHILNCCIFVLMYPDLHCRYLSSRSQSRIFCRSFDTNAYYVQIIMFAFSMGMDVAYE